MVSRSPISNEIQELLIEWYKADLKLALELYPENSNNSERDIANYYRRMGFMMGAAYSRADKLPKQK